MGYGNQGCYALSATLLVVGLSTTVAVTFGSQQLGGFFKIQAGGGTLALVSGASAISTSGYLLSAGEVIECDGPAKFFLAAAGATMTVGLVTRHSNGASLFL